MNDQPPNMILTFRLEDERFALKVEHVNEILDPIEETPVPMAPRCAPALINVRGTVVPLFDVRRRMGIKSEAPPETARIVVLDLLIADEMTRLAMHVDAVEDVVEADPNQIDVIPELGARWPREYIEGVAYHGDELVVLLNAVTLFALTEAHTTQAA